MEGKHLSVETVFELPIANVYSSRKASRTNKTKACSTRDLDLWPLELVRFTMTIHISLV